jgi:hypothetical protein
MKNLLVFSLLLFTLSIYAQYSTDTTYKKYSTGLIYRMGGYYMKGPQRITFQELGKEFSMSVIGLDQYNLAKRKFTTSRILTYASFACGIAAAAVGPSNQKLGFGFLGGQMIGLTMSMQSRAAGNKYLDQAIQIRNKNYLFPGSQ